MQIQKDVKGEFFRHVAEQGHYAGRTVPSATRQGLYACTSAGTLLASVNTRQPGELLDMLEKALAAWRAMDTGEKTAIGPYPLDPYTPDNRYDVHPPKDGLILKVYARDLPRRHDERDDDWRRQAVNMNHAWFTADEKNMFVPEEMAPGTRHVLPWAIVRRFALFHFIDNVRGETPMWGENDSRRAHLVTEVVEKEGDRLVLRLTGFVENQASGSWAIRPFQEVKPRERGIKVDVVGALHWNVERGVFERFDVVAYGIRWGGTEHNLRWDELDPTPIGFAFELASDDPADLIPPQGVYWGYFG